MAAVGRGEVTQPAPGPGAGPARPRRRRVLAVLAVLCAAGLAAVGLCWPTAPTTQHDGPAAPVLVSRGVPASTSVAGADAGAANDDDYGSAWSGPVPSWLAYDLSGVPAGRRQQVLVAWSNPSYGYSTRYGPHYSNLGSYALQVHDGAGGGVAPTSGWRTLLSVRDNTLHSRQHVLDLDGAAWFRLEVTASDGSLLNTGASVNVLDVYALGAATTPLPDDFVFYGDSITAGAMCPCPSEGVASLPELLHAGDPTRWPVVENGGDPYETSAGAVDALLGDDGYLSLFPGTYVGLSYGMNDVLGSVPPQDYAANLRTLVDAVLAAGKVPLVPTITRTDDPEVNARLPDYNAVVEALYQQVPGVVRGPDLWAWSSAHPELIGPGDVHPTPAGYAALRRQWADRLLATVARPREDGSRARREPLPSPRLDALRVSGNRIVNGAGVAVRLIGVNHSGTEYSCVGGGTAGATGYGVFEPADFGTDPAYLDAITSWGSNTVRIGLNEACWLGINGVDPAYSGASYQNAVRGLVDLATAKGLAVVLELHWSAPGTGAQFVPHGQAPMPDRDHSPALWSSVASTFKGYGNVVFDLFNEPYPHGNSDTANAWQCWRDGSDPADPTNSRRCIGTEWWDTNGNTFNGGKPYSYAVAGMQELLSAVRATGATNVVLLSGIQYANTLSQWRTWAPTDPTGNLAAAWHVYPFNSCSTATCWDATVAPVASSVPLVTAEIGDQDCRTSFAEPLMTWLDQRGASYLAWTWNTWGCGGMQLMTDYRTGAPSAFGKPFSDHFRAVTGRASDGDR